MEGNKEYFTFISYKHDDEKWAEERKKYYLE